jgi:uncharacterized protein with PQ loop repeat
MMNQKMVTRIGWLASIMGICMFFSFLDQIRLNLAGHPGSIILPVATAINCICWTAYGVLKPKRDWPLILSNGLGVCVAGVTALTAVAAHVRS